MLWWEGKGESCLQLFQRDSHSLWAFSWQKSHVQSLQAHVQGLPHLCMTLNFQVPSSSCSQPVNVTWPPRREKFSHFPTCGLCCSGNLLASRCRRIPGEGTPRNSTLLQIQIPSRECLLNSVSWENKLLLALLLQFDSKACSVNKCNTRFYSLFQLSWGFNQLSFLPALCIRAHKRTVEAPCLASCW